MKKLTLLTAAMSAATLAFTLVYHESASTQETAPASQFAACVEDDLLECKANFPEIAHDAEVLQHFAHRAIDASKMLLKGST